MSDQLHPVTFLSADFGELINVVQEGGHDKIFILVDENSMQNCMPVLMTEVADLHNAEVLEIESGEENKTLEIAEQIWISLAEQGATRKSLLINLGGGVVCDLGGFVASIYKRGIDFIHIPTTLLAQVDASLGGKVGVDHGVLKNQLGLFSLPKHVYIEPSFLSTLFIRHVKSGYAEMLKHGLIADRNYWNKLVTLKEVDAETLSGFISRSVELKMKVVSEDYKEKGIRRSLNFGHTIGHAIESYSLQNDTVPMFHGEAIAIGMVAEAFLSKNKCGLNENELSQIADVIHDHFDIELPPSDGFEDLWQLMQHDKKNEGGKVNFSLINSIGKAEVNVSCEREEVMQAFSYAKSIFK